MLWNFVQIPFELRSKIDLEYDRLNKFVGLTGLEPATSPTPKECATNCATARIQKIFAANIHKDLIIIQIIQMV